MQKLSIRKISILGLVLMGASAVTAAVLPSKPDNKLDKDKFAAGSLTNNSSIPNAAAASSITCAPDTNALNNNCNASTAAASETTGSEAGNSTSNSSLPADGGLGGNNTSDAS